MKVLPSLLTGLVWAALICLVGCATPRRLITDPAPSAASGDSGELPAIYDPRPVSILQGKASYYGKPQATASGERFNPKAMTAAHKTLPLHSVVRVVNTQNFKSVVVRINDRGPYVRGRIIDLSAAAAEKISMVGSGIVPVRVEVLRKIDIMQKPNRKVVLASGAKKASQPAPARAKTTRQSPPSGIAKKLPNPSAATGAKKASGAPASPTAKKPPKKKSAHSTGKHRKHRKHHR